MRMILVSDLGVVGRWFVRYLIEGLKVAKEMERVAFLDDNREKGWQHVAACLGGWIDRADESINGFRIACLPPP